MIKCETACPLGKFDGCCHCCPDFGSCKEECSEHPNGCGESIFNEKNEIELFRATEMTTLNRITDLINRRKELETAEKNLKDELKKAMEQHGIKKFSSDTLDIVYVPEGIKTTLDSSKVKKLHPEIAEECSKVRTASAYVKITVKGGYDD